MATGSALTLRHVSLPPSISRSPPASPCPSPFLSLSPHPLSKRRARTLLTQSASRAPVSPVDLTDPSVSSLSSSDSFEFWPPRDPNVVPYLGVGASSNFKPRLSAEPVEAVTPPSQDDYTGPSDRLSLVCDIDSTLLAARVVFVNLPFVPFISEMVISQLLYLQGVNPKEPIYMYIDTLGTSNDEEPVALESEAFAIYDVMMTLKNEVHTVALETVGGHACLLLAAGTKGKRYMMPNAQVLLPEPEVPYYGDMPTSDLVRRTREVLIQKKVLTELVAKHTGKSFEEVHELMQSELPLGFQEAKEFGIVDEMVVRGKTKLIADMPPSKKQAMRRKRPPGRGVSFLG